MTFTIPEFWCGVITAIGVEFVILVTAAVIKRKKANPKYKLKK